MRARRLFTSLGFGLVVAGGLLKLAGCSGLVPTPPDPHIVSPDPEADPHDGAADASDGDAP